MFAAVVVKQAVPVTQREFPVMTAAQWQQTFDNQAQQGYGPIIRAALTTTAAGPLERMLAEGAVLGAAQQASGNQGARARFGLDWVQWQSPGVYYGQKGGLIIDAASVFQFDGQWGFVALFGSTANRPNNLIYPNWPAVMSTAKARLANAADLFPTSGCHRCDDCVAADKAVYLRSRSVVSSRSRGLRRTR